jgi:hypothetical protein
LWEVVDNWTPWRGIVRRLAVSLDIGGRYFFLVQEQSSSGDYVWLLIYENPFPDGDRHTLVIELWTPEVPSWESQVVYHL